LAWFFPFKYADDFEITEKAAKLQYAVAGSYNQVLGTKTYSNGVRRSLKAKLLFTKVILSSSSR
jgi:hypothetical protein